MLTGYWPPTNEMLRQFSTDPNQNPGGWQGQNWEGRGYDIYAYFPEFPGGTGSNPKGNGDFEVDYQDVGSWQPLAEPAGDFWRITSQIHPVAIMSFGQGAGPWEIEYNARNLPSSTWTSDYLSPYKPTPAPPDTTQSSGYVRHSSLPAEAIAEAVNSSGLGIKAWIDWDADPGHFLCEYMAYHDSWYQDLHSDPNDPYHCVAAGFTHLAGSLSTSTAADGVEVSLRALIDCLDSQLTQYAVSGTVTLDSVPLAGVTICGLPDSPVTDANGFYSGQVGGGWSGIVTPLKSGYAFNPSQRTYSNVRADQSAQDYTAFAAIADTIQFDASSEAAGSSSGTTLSWSHTTGNGNNRILIVGAICEDSTPADQIMSSVKFDGVNMTAVPGSIKSRGNSSSTLRTELYYMLNPPVGSGTVLITYSGNVSYRIGGAVSLINVKQQLPEIVVTNAKSSATTISTDITIPNSGAWIVDVVGHSRSGSFTSSTTTERWDRNSSSHTAAGGTKAVTSTGLNTISWNYSGSSGSMVHSLAAFAPSETPVPTRTLTTSATAGGIVTIPGIGTYTYPNDTDANIIASTNANYHFVNWTGMAAAAGKVANPNSPDTTVFMDANYTVQADFAIDQKIISGCVTEPDANIPVEGVVIEATNGGGSDTTDANGYYQLAVDYGWSGTVTPHKTGYTFEPNETVYSEVITDQSSNYTAILDTFIISGCAVDSVILAPLAGVLVTPDNNGGPYTSRYYGGGSDITDANGYYEAMVDYNWSGNIVPSKYAYVFEPNSLTYINVTQDKIADQNYIGTLLTYKICGCIKNACQVPISDVLVSADGGGSDITDINGNYEVWVDYNWSGTVTPAKIHYTFEPNSITYSDVLEDQTGQGYTANNIYDLDCSGHIGFGDVAVISNNWLGIGEDIPGDLHKDNTVNLLDFADFTNVWLEE